MKILLLGAAGQLGQELLPLLSESGEVTSVDRQFIDGASSRQMEQDLGDLNRVEILLNRLCPDLVVNACAFTAVDAAEKESQLAFRLNADLPGCLARWSKRNDAMLFHYSTDYVFSGKSDEPYREVDKPDPLSVYGESKLAGEWAITSGNSRHIILRTSWVYSGHGNNFVLSMLRLAAERPSLQIVNDQIGCPTWARNLATTSVDVMARLRQQKSDSSRDGLYHYCDATVATWYQFARSIFTTGEALGLLEEPPETTPVNSTEYPQAALRPARSVLDTSLIKTTFNIAPPGLEESLTSCLQELKNRE